MQAQAWDIAPHINLIDVCKSLIETELRERRGCYCASFGTAEDSTSHSDECCFSFIAKFDVQPWDLTHLGGYLSLLSPSVYVIFYNSKNVKEFGIMIVSQCSILFPETLPCVHAYHLFYGFGMPGYAALF